MAKFTTVSRNQHGEKVTAVMEAPTRQDLIGQLKERGLTVVDLKEILPAGSKQTKAQKTLQDILSFELIAKRIDTGEQAIFWRQVATMTEAGLPIIEVLESIAQEVENSRLRKILQQVISDMWEGFSLSQSLRKHERVFSPMVVSLIGAAEESGSLPEVTVQIATFLEKRDAVIRKVQAALTYPVFLVGFFLVVVAVSTFWIIPKFREIYTGFKAKLPPITEAVFAVNAFVLEHFIWIAIVMVAAVAGAIWWGRRKSGKAFFDRLTLKLPIFGKLLQRAAVARFCRALAVLLAGGIPINRALEMVEGTSGNTIVAKAIHDMREDIIQGGKIAASMKKYPIFPKMCIRMVAAGEETGNLTSLLEKAAEFYEARVDAVVQTINTLIEPVIIIIIGGFVLIFVLALYMPIFSLALNMRG